MRPQDDDEPEPDQDLDRILPDWQAPGVPDTLDHRMLASFRARRSGGGSLLSRFWKGSVRVPLPVALAVLALIAFAVWLPRAGQRPAPAGAQEAGEPAGGAERTARADAKGAERANRLGGFQPVREVSVTVIRPGEQP
jgi:hypothetical protein